LGRRLVGCGASVHVGLVLFGPAHVVALVAPSRGGQDCLVRTAHSTTVRND
jgi:hypothetical protein